MQCLPERLGGSLSLLQCTMVLQCTTIRQTVPYPRAQGFCELKYAETVARHMEVDAVRGASGFVSGRTTAVLPNDAPNYFGIGSI